MNCEHCGKESGEYQLCPKCFEEFQNGNLCKCKNCNSYYHKETICPCMKQKVKQNNDNNNVQTTKSQLSTSGCLIFVLLAIIIIATVIIIKMITVNEGNEHPYIIEIYKYFKEALFFFKL